jgi:hypothetical protein
MARRLQQPHAGGFSVSVVQNPTLSLGHPTARRGPGQAGGCVDRLKRGVAHLFGGFALTKPLLPPFKALASDR